MNSDQNTPAPGNCLAPDLLSAYAACTLAKQQASHVEDHLNDCNHCRRVLVTLIEGGTEPTWLNEYRQVHRTHTLHFDSTVPIERQSTPPTSVRLTNRLGKPLSMPAEERYRLVRVCGEGGMGQVWEGWDLVMDRAVALKQLRVEPTDGRQRIFQEASSLARLSHSNIVAIFEFIELQQRPTLVMEYIDGPNLSSYGKQSIVGERNALRLMSALAGAIQHAHDQGVVHRDLKPSNVLLSWPPGTESKQRTIETAHPKITDFGLARINAGEDLTRTGELLGTPAYMAPEQTLGQASVVDHSADIYGLGAILYELLTGTAPHTAEDPLATLMLVREREPIPPRWLRPELSKDIETICLKCLQKSPKDRYESARALQADLDACLQGRPISARRLNPLVAALRWSRRHKPQVIAAAVVLFSLVSISLLSWRSARSERRLRISADEAQIRAKSAETTAMREAERANATLAITQQHFDTAIQQMQELSYLVYAPRVYNQPFNLDDYQARILTATSKIYQTYLNSLPEPQHWTFREALQIVRYVESMQHLTQNNQQPNMWLDKLSQAIDRIERDYAEHPDVDQVMLRYRNAMSRQAEREGDFQKAGAMSEAAARVFDLSLQRKGPSAHIYRFYSHTLMNAALQYRKAHQADECLRLANESIVKYRKAIELTDNPADDDANLLDKFVYHGQLAREFDRTEEAVKFATDFKAIANKFKPGMPLFERVDGIARSYAALSIDADGAK